MLAAPMKLGHLCENEIGVLKVRNSLWREKLRDKDDVVECNGHAATGEGVAHVKSIAKEDQSVLRRGGSGEEGVWHGGETVGFNGLCKRLLYALGEVGHNLFAEVLLQTAFSCRRDARHINEHSSFVGTDLV